MRLTLKFCHASKLLSENVKKKLTKADVIKRLMQEHKASFGELLETKREKLRRLKLEKKGAINRTNLQSTENSELSWTLKVSNNRMKLVKFDCNTDLSVSTFYTPLQKIVLREKTRDTKLDRFQTSIIRKTSRDDTEKHEILPSVETADDSLAKTVIDTKLEVPKKLEQAIPKPSESTVIRENNLLESKIHNHSENSFILLPREMILKNINKATIYEKNTKNAVYNKSSEIFSLSPWENKEYSKLPSVTNILNVTMSDDSRKMLELWMARMIDKMGQEAFDKYKRDLIQNGKLLHSTIDDTLRKIPVDVPENLKPCYDSVKMVLDEVEHVRVIESQVVHENLGYRGVVDCVATYRGNLCLIDWKKSDKPKHLLSSTYDAPLQIASYIGALNADKNYPFKIKSGLLVIAYTLGDPATVFTLDETRLQYYWKLWLGRLKRYYTMQNT